MINPVWRKILGLASGQPPADPARFNDPLALQTQWTPASRGGSNFRTHRLVEIDVARVEFRASGAAKFFYSFFALVGIVCAVVFLFGADEPLEFTSDTMVPVLVGVFFAFIGGFMFYSGTTPIVFDKGIGYYWRGRKSPQDVLEVSSLKKCARLDQIHAIQLVSEWVRGSKTSYYSYELNLVLEDASRMTVIDHGNLSKLREDARKLADFLGKPVWDSIDR